MTEFIPSPLNPDWLIPRGWEDMLGADLEYRLGTARLRLLRAQLNRHLRGGADAAPHAHPHHQLLYYRDGGGTLVSRKTAFPFSAGDIFFVPAGCSHAARADRDVTCLALDFMVDLPHRKDAARLPAASEAAVLFSLVHARQPRPFPLRSVDRSAIETCIATIGREAERRETGFATLIQARLLELVALCLRATRRAKGFGAHFRHTAWRHRLLAQRAIALVAAEATRQPELTLREVARRCCASYNHLNRVLRAESGFTFHQHLLRHRLEAARALLESGRANCSEAAIQSGFNDSNYFSRAFRKTYGFAPSELGRPNR